MIPYRAHCLNHPHTRYEWIEHNQQNCCTVTKYIFLFTKIYIFGFTHLWFAATAKRFRILCFRVCSCFCCEHFFIILCINEIFRVKILNELVHRNNCFINAPTTKLQSQWMQFGFQIYCFLTFVLSEFDS